MVSDMSIIEDRQDAQEEDDSVFRIHEVFLEVLDETPAIHRGRHSQLRI
jgi:hypothetical protein